MSIRKPWAVLLGLNLVAFVVGLYPYFTLLESIHPFQVLQLVLDIAMLYGLFGYVTYKPINHLALRLLYLLLVPIIGLKVSFATYLVAPNLLPWVGHPEQYVSAGVLLVIPVALLTAFALWSYATKPQAPSA